MQKSKSFILPLFKIPSDILPFIENTYMGHYNYDGDDNWGNYFYITIQSQYYKDYVASFFRHHERFLVETDAEDFVIVILAFTKGEIETIVTPFLEGQYSNIDREYVKQHFPMRDARGNISLNWRILQKDILNPNDQSNVYPLRKMWEELTDCSIPDNAEVWSRPKKEDEIFDYSGFLISQEFASQNTMGKDRTPKCNIPKGKHRRPRNLLNS